MREAVVASWKRSMARYFEELENDKNINDILQSLKEASAQVGAISVSKLAAEGIKLNHVDTKELRQVYDDTLLVM
jgi:hypothetical protein